MKKILILGIGLMLLVGLVACGENEYEDEITTAVQKFKDDHGAYAEKVKRKNSAILVYDDGKYIGIASEIEGRTVDSYYKKMSDTKNHLELVTNLDTENYIKEDAKVSYKERHGKELEVEE
ncbi:hypothetical protein HCJ66_14910 [Listeria sp. FSL L7-1582]|uniref:hypothetical protein n=1 Tax=Listeria portnoyi TaxID=2713504 RepID=UPI00164D5391|nr:hypothetical protein [Listeria portnoyi]MBC6310829.1 hypothetical protein [Listeria portnoyi]